MKNAIITHAVMDLETVPRPGLEGHPVWEGFRERKVKNDPDFGLQRASLYGEWGMVCCAGFLRLDDNLDILRERGYTASSLEEEAAILESIFPVLDDAHLSLIGHNILAFDNAFLAKRYLFHGKRIPESLRVGDKKPWEILHVDTMKVLKFSGYENMSLETACDFLGVPSPKKNLHGYDVYQYFLEGRLEEIKEYCLKGDCISTHGVFRKLSSLNAL